MSSVNRTSAVASSAADSTIKHDPAPKTPSRKSFSSATAASSAKKAAPPVTNVHQQPQIRVPSQLNSPTPTRVVAGKSDTPAKQCIPTSERMGIWKVNKFFNELIAAKNRNLDKTKTQISLKAFVAMNFKYPELVKGIRLMIKHGEAKKALKYLTSAPGVVELREILYPKSEYWILISEARMALGDIDGMLEALEKGIKNGAEPEIDLSQKLRLERLKLDRDSDLKYELVKEESEIVSEIAGSSGKKLSARNLSDALKIRKRIDEESNPRTPVSTPSHPTRDPSITKTPISDKLRRKLALIDEESTSDHDDSTPVEMDLSKEFEKMNIATGARDEVQEPVDDARSELEDSLESSSVSVNLSEILGEELNEAVEQAMIKAKTPQKSVATKKVTLSPVMESHEEHEEGTACALEGDRQVPRRSSRRESKLPSTSAKTPSKKVVDVEQSPKPKSATKTKNKENSQLNNGINTEGGSIVMLASVRSTPKKQKMYDSPSLVSPVRRSMRLNPSLSKAQSHHNSDLPTVLGKSNYVYVPNPALNTIQEGEVYVPTAE